VRLGLTREGSERSYRSKGETPIIPLKIGNPGPEVSVAPRSKEAQVAATNGHRGESLMNCYDDGERMTGCTA